MEQSYHIPVLLNEVTEGLKIVPEGVYVDCTFGGGGHSEAILGKLGPKALLIAFDLVAVHSTQDAKISAKAVYHKNPMFWFGAVLVGMIAPLVLVMLDLPAPAGAAALLGMLAYERVWVRAGQIVPLS